MPGSSLVSHSGVNFAPFQSFCNHLSGDLVAHLNDTSGTEKRLDRTEREMTGAVPELTRCKQRLHSSLGSHAEARH
jgi:hypothetical protein